MSRAAEGGSPADAGQTAGMELHRTCTHGTPPEDPVGRAAADLVGELLGQATISLHYTPAGGAPCQAPDADDPDVLASATEEVVEGWQTTMTVHVDPQVAPLVASAGTSLPEPLVTLPDAALRAARALAHGPGQGAAALEPALKRVLRDAVVVEFLHGHQPWTQLGGSPSLVAEALEYLLELSGTRVEAKHVTHGVVITDALPDEPRLKVPYPAGLRSAKRSPLLFDGQRSVLLVDPHGWARTELQRHRLERLLPGVTGHEVDGDAFVDSGSLVALATRRLGGIGLFLREDRSIWTFVDGRPLVIRRGEHWTAFPLWLAASLGASIGGGHAIDLLVQAAVMISVQPNGAILGIVEHADDLAGAVAPKDRFDRRDTFDPVAMRPETRLHHLIDAEEMDAHTLARLAALDGATVVDRDGRLLAYGAIVTSADSEHEGARTAAARTLSLSALCVLKVSQDGEIAVFRDGQIVATLLASGGAAAG